MAKVQVRAGAYVRPAAATQEWRSWFEKYQGCKVIRTRWLAKGDEGVTGVEDDFLISVPGNWVRCWRGRGHRRGERRLGRPGEWEVPQDTEEG